MSDPFAPNSNAQLVREARIGLTAVAVVLVVFVAVVYLRVTGTGRQLPSHVRTAPVAEPVWPHSEPPADSKITEHRPGLVFSQTGPTSIPPAHATEPLPHNHAELAIAKRRVKPTDFPGAIHPGTTAKRKTSPARDSIGLTRKPERITNQYTKRQRVDENPATSITPTPQETIAAVSRTLDEIRTTAEELKNDLSIAPAAFEKVVQDAPLAKVEPNALRQLRSNSKSISKTPKKPGLPIQAKPLAAVRPVPASETSDRLSPKIATQTQSHDSTPKHNSDKTKGPKNPECLEPRPAFEPARPVIRKTPNITLADAQDNSFPFATANSNRPTAKTKLAKAATSAPQDFAPNTLRTSQANTFPIASPARLAEPATSSGAAKPLAVQPKSGKTKSQAPIAKLPSQTTEEHSTDYYESREGDSFWSIAQQHYGDGRYFRSLFQYNLATVPNFENIPPGSRISLPPKRDLATIWPDLCPVESDDSTQPFQRVSHEQLIAVQPNSYVTQEGQTLFSIAARQLGQASRYLEIKALNEARLAELLRFASAPGDEPLPAGLKLAMPDQ